MKKLNAPRDENIRAAARGEISLGTRVVKSKRLYDRASQKRIARREISRGA